MANPIKTSDLYQDTGELRQLLEDLKAVEAQYKELLKIVGKEAIKLKADIEGLNVTNAQHREELKKSAQQAAKLQKAQQRYQEAISDTATEIAKLKLQTAEANRIKKLEIKLARAAEGSYEKLSAQYSLNKIKLNKMSEEERKATKAGQELERQTREIYEEMKKLQEATGKHTLNVGNYKEATRELLGELKLMPDAFDKAKGAVSTLSTGFKALLANPVVLFISLIVGGLAALFKAFKSSERGATLMAKATGLLKAGFSILVKISDKLVGAIISAFSNPLGAIKKLGKAIVQNVINRFRGLIDVVTNTGRALAALARGDFKALKKASGEAAQAVSQVFTGMTPEDQRRIARGFRDITKGINDMTQAFINLEAAQRTVKRQNIALQKQLERLRTEEEEQLAIQEDDTRGFEERQRAAEKAREATIKAAQVEIQIARNRLNLLNEELRLRKANAEDTLDLEEQQLEAYSALAEAERSYTTALLDGDEKRRRLIQDTAERNLDILLDGFDNQKTINERKLKDERLTFDERKKILDETVKLGEETFAKQIETLQAFTDKRINANELLAESDAVALNQRIRSLGLSEILEGRLLEVIRDRRTAIQDLSEAQQELAAAEKNAALEAEKAAKKKREEQSKSELDAFDQQQALAEAQFNLTERTEKEKTRFQLEAQKARYQKLIELAQKYGTDLTDTELETYKTLIQGIDTELGKLNKTNIGESLYDTLGIKVTDAEKDELKNAFDFAKSQLEDWASFRTQKASEAVAAAEEEVQAARDRLQAEIEARNQGFAHSVQTAEKELAQAQKNRQKALEQERRAQRAEQRIKTAEQAVNLVTASTKIWAQFGFPFALVPLSILWGSFISAKVRAARLTKPNREGGFEWLGGPGHHRGAESIELGMTQDGRIRTASAGEGLAIFNERAARKYGKIIPEVVDAINAGKLERIFSSNDAQDGAGGKFYANMDVDVSKMENTLERIYEQGGARTYIDAKGRLVEERGNKRTIYV